jgi:3-methyladenine DNA glycosylase Tag
MKDNLMHWQRIKDKLATRYPILDARVDLLHQVPAVKDRARGRQWTDREVFEALILSILSNSTDWSKVETVRHELGSIFQNFDIAWYAGLTRAHVSNTLIPWFQNRRVGSPFQSKDLVSTIATTQQFLRLTSQHGSLEAYFRTLLAEQKGDLPSLALALGGAKSRTKLPGLGIPLAAEFLKDIGYDVAKPDRHMNRAAGSFRWIRFRKWPNSAETTAPTTAVQKFAQERQLLTSYVDNAVWLLCAKSGLFGLPHEKRARS